MIYLDATTKKLQVVLEGAITTNQLEISTYYFDYWPYNTTTVRRGGQKVSSTNNTTDVDIVEAPGSQGVVRNVHTVMIHNKDTADATVIVKLDNSGTETVLVKVELLSEETLVYEDQSGWDVLSPVTINVIDSESNPDLTFLTSGTTTITLPTTGTMATTATSQTIQNKTFDNSNIYTAVDDQWTLQDDGDTTKQLQFQLSGITTATTRTLTIPDASTTIVGTDTTQTLTNKTWGDDVVFSADLTPAEITSSQNNYAPTGHATAASLRLSSDARWNITGLAGGAAGRVVWIYNVDVFPLVFTYEDTNSSAANRFAFGCTLGGGQAMGIMYDSTASRWRGFSIPEPVGMIRDFGSSTVPAGYLGCDGSAVSRTTYAALFNEIGTTWGVGDGSTTFNVPDFRRRVAVGSGGSGTSELDDLVGSTGGDETHTLLEAEIPSHNHSVSDAGHTHATTITNWSSGGAGAGFIGPGSGSSGQQQFTSGNNSQTGISINNTGGGGAHNNMQPSAVVLKIIKYV